jgi:type I restriction enzyme S subunit
MSYKTFPSTVRSGVGWLGDIPSHWEVVPAKALFTLRAEKALPEDVHLTPSQKFGVLPQVEYMEITGSRVVLNLTDSGQMKHVEPNDFVSHLRSFQGGLELSQIRGKVSGAYTVLRLRKDQNPDYWKYALKSDTYIQALQTTTDQLRDGQSIRLKEFAQIPLPLVPRAEQDAIVEFLDQELQEVDALQVRNTRLLEQLGLRRESLISSFIEAKDSAWPLVPLKYEVVLNPDVLPEDTDPNEVLNYIEIGDVNLEKGISGFTPVAFSEAPSRARRLVRNGDVLISTVRTYLKAIGQVKESQNENRIVASTGFAVLRPNQIEPRFLRYAVSSDTFIQNIQAYSTGISYPAINSSQLVKFKIPVPPMAVQVEIADNLDRHLASIDKLQEQTTNLIFTLQERRSSIISSVVTGQIDVTGRS